MSLFGCFPHCDRVWSTQSDRIEHKLNAIIEQGAHIMTDLTTLANDFDTYKTDVAAAFARLEASVAAAGGIPADVQAQIDALDTAIQGADADANAEDQAPVVDGTDVAPVE